VLATRVDGLVVVPPTDGQTEETRYVIDNNFHRFFLVRGDAALDGHDNPTVLPPLAADSTRWYIYRWIDETVIQAGAPAGASSRASTASTWGSVKARYR
jgi:hypothetical protein